MRQNTSIETKKWLQIATASQFVIVLRVAHLQETGSKLMASWEKNVLVASSGQFVSLGSPALPAGLFWTATFLTFRTAGFLETFMLEVLERGSTFMAGFLETFITVLGLTWPRGTCSSSDLKVTPVTCGSWTNPNKKCFKVSTQSKQ